MASLFQQRAKAHYQMHAPLAERLRPRTLEDFVGQEGAVGEHSFLRAAIHEGRPHSMIFWGPPGTGKTTLARIIAEACDANFTQLSATGAGVKEVREAIAGAKTRAEFDAKRTIVFIDEIHRFNKGQQDSLLHAMEDGTIILLGATTENPSFEINAAILSRAQLIVLQRLDDAALATLLERAIRDQEAGLGSWQLSIDEAAKSGLLRYAQGDARSLLNALELSALRARARLAEAASGAACVIGESDVRDAIGEQALAYDKSGEDHYNLASALIKSMRASDADAAIYYTVRMLKGGEKPEFVARRMAIFASEDIGNAAPNALTMAAAAIQVISFIGLPEALYTLTQLASFLALAPKSDGAKAALKRASQLVAEHGPLPVPLFLRNAPTAMMKDLGYGAEYRTPHGNVDGLGDQSHLPDKISATEIYAPVERGFEVELGKRLSEMRTRFAARTTQPETPRQD